MVEKKTNGKHANHQHSLEQLIESLAAKAGVSTASANELTKLIEHLTAARDIIDDFITHILKLKEYHYFNRWIRSISARKTCYGHTCFMVA